MLAGSSDPAVADQGRTATMDWIRRHFPFNAEQTINILSEFGPLITMFVVNGVYGITAGTYALMIATVIAILSMLMVLGRLPIFPLIASAVTITFGALTLITGDPMWVQIKVTIFNLLFAVFLFIGLWIKRNFFKYVFDKTFHYTEEGWNKFTWNFAWFFVLTAVANEAVRQGFEHASYEFLGRTFVGVDIWILFKLFIVMPLSGVFAWWQTSIMQKYRLPEPGTAKAAE
jgi:intracellular septation protein